MLKNDCWIIFFLLLFCGQLDLNIACSEHAVKNSIFDGYDNMVRSVKNQSSITHVTVSMVINSIVSINEQEEKIELLTWTTLSWTDEFLQWNPTDFGGCEMINTLASNVWMPDYFVVNLLETEEILAENLLYAVILNNGTIFSSVPLHATLRCTMDITQFPFDTQNCTITAGTWMYTSDHVVLHMSKDIPENAAGVLQKIIKFKNVAIGLCDTYGNRWHKSSRKEWHGSSEFETISFTAEEHTHVDMNKTFSELRFILILKRRPEYYVYVLFIPSFLLTMLCIIGIFTPTSSEGCRNEKMTLGLTTLLSMAVILNITADAMPKSSKGLPLLGYYVLYEIGMCSLSTILSTVIICVHERANRESWNPPAVIRWMASIPSPYGYVTRVLPSGKKTQVSTVFHKTLKENLVRNGENIAKAKDFHPNPLLHTTVEGKEILAGLQQITSKIDDYLKNLNDEKEKMNVWASALVRIDLFLLITLFIMNIVLTCVIIY